VHIRTVQRWLEDNDFSAEVDRLTLMTGIAARAERLRIAKRVVAQRIRKEDGFVHTKHDLLDWLKFVQGETDGIKLDLAALADLAAPLADPGQAGTGQEESAEEPAERVLETPASI
jgi:hypothetical protein